MGNDGGMGLKPSDFRTVALCHRCHHSQHQYGERSFWGDTNPDVVIISLLVNYMGDTKEVISALENRLDGGPAQ